ncbi:hypothetical protein [Paraburkholderia nodosa]|nr:hypothetical protein [Paraburkholderia nodosa]
MMQLQFLPPEIARQSISRKEIVVPLDAAIAAIEAEGVSKPRAIA